MMDSGFGLAAYGDAVAYRFGGAMAAARLGAVGALVRSSGGSQNRLAHTGSMGYADGVTKIPGAAVTFEDAQLISNLASQGRVRINMLVTPQTLPDAVSCNVLVDLNGCEKPDEVVIVSGHLDSWDLATGAIDDAAGVAVSMQTAYLLKQLRLHPKRTIRVIAWMNEENGGRGSEAYAAEQAANTYRSGALGEHQACTSVPRFLRHVTFSILGNVPLFSLSKRASRAMVQNNLYDVRCRPASLAPLTLVCSHV